MENEMIKYLSKHIDLTDKLTNVIVESTIIKSFKKGTILLREGELSNKSYFVFKGCIRSYMLKDGEDRTIEFYTEEQPVSPLSYETGVPSTHYLECIEDTVVSLSTAKHEKEMFQKYPTLESVCRVIGEVMMSNYQEAFIDYKMMTPEERYTNLIKTRQNLIQRVPQYQLASYLGIKPESLSRIRKRLKQK
ncbi:MAG: Crp/Fnr family transcriptional regulator [Aureispira sp.]|nr:Crp/Fnr family transcriptional regulator [Aureispira sp.]